MTAPQASSRLEMLQARFQQKQLQEKEQKLLQLYDQQQQRAYQVVQRGSAGSNSSNHGCSTAARSTTSTTTTTTTHTTSTSQGGKVRQMFDERRQTVKGIDRSYPLEPLENKSRKQTNTNGLATQRNPTLNRQSVNVKRVTRADVNSNINGGKPVVSYHEEIMRESFGQSVRRHDDEDEFGVENRVATFANGYYRHEADNKQEEVLDQETVEKNRMMAKIHLMGFDDSLKHHVRNDLENEEFPEYLMDVPDKVPKRNVTKKLSQAEARLERFKNANAKRNMPRQLTSTSNVIKKRSEQTIPTKSNSKRSEIVGTSSTGTKSEISRISDRSQRILENVKNFLPAENRVVEINKKRKENSDTEMFNRRHNSQSFFKKYIKAENTSLYSRKTLNGFKSLTADGKIFIRRNTRPQFFCKESERSGTTMSIDRKSDSSGSPLFYRDALIKRSKSPYFFLNSESEKSRTSESKSPLWEKEISSRRSTSPQYLRYGFKRSETAMSTDRETTGSISPKWNKEILTKRDTIDFEKKFRISDTILDQKTSSKPILYEREILKKRNTSPQFFCKESERSGTTMSIESTIDESKSPSYNRDILLKRSASPRFFCKESERSGTTMSIDQKINKPKSPTYNQDILKQSITPHLSNRKIKQRPAVIDDRQYDKFRLSETIRDKREKSSTSPQFFCKESEKSATTMLIEPKSSSTDSTKTILKQRSYTLDNFYKPSMKPLSSINKINFSQDRHNINSSIHKHETKKALKKDKIPNIVTESRRSSKISETSATSTSSIVSLKYGLEFDNILQSAGLVRKIMKSQNGKQHEVHQSKENIKKINTSVAKNNHSKSRYKTSSPFQKEYSPSIETKRRATPESPRKSITPTEVDMEIQEIIMTDHRIETDKLQKTANPILRRQTDGTYIKSFGDKTKFKTSFTYPVRKIQKERTSILKPRVFKSKENSPGKNKESKNYRTYGDGEENAISLNKLDCSSLSETSRYIITRSKEDENRVSKVKTSQTQEQTWSKSAKDQVERAAFRSRKREDLQCTAPRSLKQTRARSTGTRISKATSPDFSNKRKYSDNIVSHLHDPEEQSKGTRTEFDQLQSEQSARIIQDTLKKKNVSTSDEYNKKETGNKNENEEVDKVGSEIDIKYQKIVKTALNKKIKDYRKITRSNFTDKNIDKDIILRKTTISNTSKKGCGRQHDIKSKISSPVPSIRKIAKKSHDTDASKILPFQKITSRNNKNFTSKFLINTVKDGSAIIAKKSANLSNKTNVKHIYKIEKSENTAKKSSKILTPWNESEKNFERMDSVESALKKFDSIGAEFERSSSTSYRPSPEISLQMMDAQTKNSAKQIITSNGLTLTPSSKITDNTVLKCTPKSSVNKDLEVKNYLYKSDLKIPSKKIYSSKKLEKKIKNTIQNKKSTQTRSPVCKRRLFESDSEKETQESNYVKTRKKENYSSANFKFRKDKADSKVISSEDLDHEDTKKSQKLQEMSMSYVKPLRSIEDIRKSIDSEQNKIITAKESRSAIANRRSVSRQDVDAGRSISATSAAKNVFLGDNPARLTKAKSCVSRITKSPSPDSATRKHHETNTRTTRGSAPSSPSKSPDIASKYASTEVKNQETKASGKSAVTKGADSTGSKAATTGVVDIIDGAVLENDSLHESKKADAFIIDFDDQPVKESDIIPSKKSPMKKSSSNKQQTASNVLDRPSSVSSNSSVSLTHGQVSSTKNKMTTKAKAPASGGSPTKGPFSARSNGTSAGNLIPCKQCGRTFAEDRIAYHEGVCMKTEVALKKRKKFDATTFRIKGTEHESFVKKNLTNSKKQEMKKSWQPKSDWRRKHEDFINTIRSAKQLQAHLTAGGNLKDFPPPPPSDTSDYIQCPHCNRKFNQAAAERHIPKCETMLHNKPAHLRASRPRR